MLLEQRREYDLTRIPFNKSIRYKELCEALCIERQRGSKLQKQMNDLLKDFEIVKDGREYTIIKYYTEKDRLDKLYFDNIKSHVEMLICTLLTYPTIIDSRKIDMSEFLEVLSIVNKDYNITKYGENKRYATELLDIDDISYTDIFFNETDTMFSRIIRDSLNELQDKKIIEYDKYSVLVKKIFNEKGKWIDKEEYELLLDWERKAILTCQNEVLTDMGYTKESQIFADGDIAKKRYRDEVAKRLNCDYFHNRYKLIINTNHILEYTIKDQIERKKVEKACNKLVKKKVMESKQGKLKLLSDEYRQLYIDNFIDSSVDNNFRAKYKELQKLEEELNVQ